MTQELAVRTTPIPGLFVLDLPVHRDVRGWFKENWQRDKMTALGLPDFAPVQSNLSFNDARSVTRGLHAEPWDKMVSLASGRILGAWVDLRRGDTFGATFTLEFGIDQAVFVPRGVANGYQSLEPGTTYSYLVNDHWSPQARTEYVYLNLADETVAIDWPIPLTQAIISDADADHPRLADVTPMTSRSTVILGAHGQLGQALRALYPDALAFDRDDLDVTDPAAVAAFPWAGVGTIINAAAWTAVDAAETPDGRVGAWAVNVTAVQNLVAACRKHRITLVHLSSDYVFDGTRAVHLESEPVSPLGVYGASKAAGDAIVATLPHHYLVRTSWVIGAGANFVSTMRGLAERGAAPCVVDDQFGRLTFASTLAAGIKHLLDTQPDSGTYNLTNTGPERSWYEIARQVFALVGGNPDAVSPQSTRAYGEGKVVSPRPRHSTLDLSKITATGFSPPAADDLLRAYLA